jgi:predicted nucleic-acid-binding Zn-ribbon protein
VPHDCWTHLCITQLSKIGIRLSKLLHDIHVMSFIIYSCMKIEYSNLYQKMMFSSQQQKYFHPTNIKDICVLSETQTLIPRISHTVFSFYSWESQYILLTQVWFEELNKFLFKVKNWVEQGEFLDLNVHCALINSSYQLWLWFIFVYQTFLNQAFKHKIITIGILCSCCKFP